MKRIVLLIGLILLPACSAVRPPAATAPPTETPAPPTATVAPSETPVPPTEAPSETPAPPTETPVPSETPLPEPTAPPTPDPYEGRGDLLFADPFDVAVNWGVGQDEEAVIQVGAGVLTMTLEALFAPTVYRISPTGKVATKNRTVADFYGQVTVRAAECHPQSEYGLVFRGTGTQEAGFDQWYAFVVRCEGTWAVYRYLDGEFFVTAGSLTPSPTVNTGPNAVNQLGIRAAGEEFRLYVNGLYLDTDSDPGILGEGRFGVYGATPESGRAVFTFDDFSVWRVTP